LLQFYVFLKRFLVVFIVNLPLEQSEVEFEVLPEHLESLSDLLQFVPYMMPVVPYEMTELARIALQEVSCFVREQICSPIQRIFYVVQHV